MGHDKRNGKRELAELDRGIKAFYTGEISTEEFVEKYWHDSWNSLITYVEQSGFNMRNGKIPQALINKKEQYEQGAVEYYRKYYIYRSVEIGKKYFASIDKQDIETCIKYLVETGQFSSKSMDETIRQYLGGKIPEIQERPISRAIPKKDVPVVPDWYIPWKKGPYVNGNVRQYYNGQLSTQNFVKRFGGTWEEFLDTLVEVGKVKSKDDISQKVLDKKEQFETEVIKYFGDEYCEMTQISVNGHHIHPTIEDIDEAIKFMRQNGIGIGKNTVTQTLTKYLRGEIEVQQEPENLNDLPGEELDADIQQTEIYQEDLSEKEKNMNTCAKRYIENKIIIEAYASQCNDANCIETFEASNGQSKMLHYMLENGMHVYIMEGVAGQTTKEIRISKRPLVSIDRKNWKEGVQENFLCYKEEGQKQASVDFTMHRTGKVGTDRNAGIGWTVSPVDAPSGHAYLPDKMSDNHDFVPNGYDMEEGIEDILKYVLAFGVKDKEAGEWYKQALSDYNDIVTNVPQRAQGEAQIANEDLEALPTEELQRVLEATIASNKAKESELEATRRAQLLSRIRAEQQRGKMLDEQISAIKANMSRGV